MRVRSLHLWAVLLPTVAIILVDYARHELVTGVGHTWWEEAALLVGVLIVVLATSQALFGRIDRSQRREHESETLRQMGMEMTSTLELEAILASVLTRGCTTLGVDCLGLAMSHLPGREVMLQTRGAAGPRRMQATATTSFLWDVMGSGEWQEVDRSTPVSAEGACMYCRRCLAIPLRMGAQMLGAICVGSSRIGPYSESDRNLAGQMANLVSIAIANALLHERARNVATLEERERIAREMHDTLAQVLGLLSMKAGGARELLRGGEIGRVDAELREIGQMADDAYLDVREAILGLRTSARTSGRITEALDEYLAKFSRQSGVAVRLDVEEGVPFDLPARIEIQLVRVIQEAVTNVRKHARATAVLVKLEWCDGRVRVSVRDDGQGFDPGRTESQTEGGYGITAMRERLDGIGGKLEIESSPDRGTVVTATVPLASELGARNGDS